MYAVADTDDAPIQVVSTISGAAGTVNPVPDSEMDALLLGRTRETALSETEISGNVDEVQNFEVPEGETIEENISENIDGENEEQPGHIEEVETQHPDELEERNDELKDSEDEIPRVAVDQGEDPEEAENSPSVREFDEEPSVDKSPQIIVIAESENTLLQDLERKASEILVEEESVTSNESIKKSPTPLSSSKSSPSPQRILMLGHSPIVSVDSSPLDRNRLSFGSDQPSAPPGTPVQRTPTEGTPPESLTLAFVGGSLDSETERSTEGTVQSVRENPNEDEDVPSYWILPPPGSRLASRKKRPSFFIRQKMQMIEERDQKLKRGVVARQSQQRQVQCSALKEKHFQEVWHRYGQLMDEWWTKKEDGLQRKTERVRQIERCQETRAKDVSRKMFLDGMNKFQKEKERLAKQREERQQLEILNAWLTHMSRQ
ncbi:Hypothetical predicted protein [Cloeon dipterum]|uniref:Uncharacterized protein n=1 Tax=Cloeon dipterum TaxID=197152 RepID=A0A8S1CPH6_9INSE|nr:Hypothetical predicted protein [Cloeon dipterum]